MGGDCSFAPCAVTAIANALESNTVLKFLNLSGCMIANETLEAFAMNLPENYSLEFLILDGMRNVPKDISCFIDAIKKNDRLKCVSVQKSGLIKARTDEIQNAIRTKISTKS